MKLFLTIYQIDIEIHQSLINITCFNQMQHFSLTITRSLLMTLENWMNQCLLATSHKLLPLPDLFFCLLTTVIFSNSLSVRPGFLSTISTIKLPTCYFCCHPCPQTSSSSGPCLWFPAPSPHCGGGLWRVGLTLLHGTVS